MAVNNVVVNGKTIVDLTNDTVTPETLATGITAHDKSGEIIVGTMTTGGSSDSWKLINDFSLGEPNSDIDIATDTDGNSFSLKKIKIIANFKPLTEGTNPSLYISFNGESKIVRYISTQLNSTAERYYIFSLDAADAVPVLKYTAFLGNTVNLVSTEYTFIPIESNLISSPITAFHLYMYGGPKFGVGTTLKVYGIRANTAG